MTAKKPQNLVRLLIIMVIVIALSLVAWVILRITTPTPNSEQTIEPTPLANPSTSEIDSNEPVATSSAIEELWQDEGFRKIMADTTALKIEDWQDRFDQYDDFRSRVSNSGEVYDGFQLFNLLYEVLEPELDRYVLLFEAANPDPDNRQIVMSEVPFTVLMWEAIEVMDEIMIKAQN